MLSIYAQITKDRNEARKAKESEKVLVLSTIIGEMSLQSVPNDAGVKDVSNESAIAVIKKSLKGLDEMLSIVPAGSFQATSISSEKSLLKSYLPSQLSEEDLREIAGKFIVSSGMSAMSDIMAHFKSQYTGLYDGKLASQIAKEFVNK